MSDKLTSKQQRFVKSYAAGRSATEAVVEAGYKVTSRESASSLGTEMTANPKIQVALAEALAEEFPQCEKESMAVLRDIIRDQDSAPAMRIKAIETLAKIFGWNAPSKSANLTVSKKLSLPED